MWLRWALLLPLVEAVYQRGNPGFDCTSVNVAPQYSELRAPNHCGCWLNAENSTTADFYLVRNDNWLRRYYPTSDPLTLTYTNTTAYAFPYTVYSFACGSSRVFLALSTTVYVFVPHLALFVDLFAGSTFGDTLDNRVGNSPGTSTGVVFHALRVCSSCFPFVVVGVSRLGSSAYSVTVGGTPSVPTTLHVKSVAIDVDTVGFNGANMMWGMAVQPHGEAFAMGVQWTDASSNAVDGVMFFDWNSTQLGWVQRRYQGQASVFTNYPAFGNNGVRVALGINILAVSYRDYQSSRITLLRITPMGFIADFQSSSNLHAGYLPLDVAVNYAGNYVYWLDEYSWNVYSMVTGTIQGTTQALTFPRYRGYDILPYPLIEAIGILGYDISSGSAVNGYLTAFDMRQLLATQAPSIAPTGVPSVSPTPAPSPSPTVQPSSAPTVSPTPAPSSSPTVSPTPAPSSNPTPAPSSSPTAEPTPAPTVVPGQPSAVPTAAPSPQPSVSPTSAPSASPTRSPTSSPTVSPTPAPSSLPTPAPTPAPTYVAQPVANVQALACSQPSVYGPGTRFAQTNAQLCVPYQTCPSLNASNTCAETTVVDLNGRRCAGFVRNCTESELRTRCPATYYSEGSVCHMLCDLENPFSCNATGTLTCPVIQFPHTCIDKPNGQCPYYDGSSRIVIGTACRAFCGAGVANCTRNGDAINVNDCVCGYGKDPSAGVGRYCPLPGASTVCTDAQTWSYCGIDGVRDCRMRSYFLNATAAEAINNYFNFVTFTGDVVAASALLGFFDDASSVDRLVLPAFFGLVRADIPECLCTSSAGDAWMSGLPTGGFGYFVGYARIGFTSCSGRHMPWLTDYVTNDDIRPAYQGGDCNGMRLRNPSSVCHTVVGTRQAWLNAPTNIPVSVWWGHSHVLIDTNYWLSDFPVGGDASVVMIGYARSAQVLSAYRAGLLGPASATWDRYVMIRTNPWDCEFDYLRQFCGGSWGYSADASSTGLPYQRCLDQEAILWELGKTIVHPVRVCWRFHSSGMTRIYRADVTKNFLVYDNATYTGAQTALPRQLTPSCTGSLWFNTYRLSSPLRDVTGMCDCGHLMMGPGCSTPSGVDVGFSNWIMGPPVYCDFVGAALANMGGYGQRCTLPRGWVQRVYCVHGTYDLVNEYCVCDAGWRVSGEGRCTLPALGCSNYTLVNTCTANGGYCSGNNQCVCPSGSVRDCVACYNVANGYWTGAHCDVPVMDPPCSAHGTVSVRTNGDLYCACDLGWGGEYCTISMCPVANNQTCGGHGTCTRVAPYNQHTCNQNYVAPADRAGVSWINACYLSGSTDLLTMGCACEYNVTQWCIAPGDTRICSGDQDTLGYTRCAARPWNGTGAAEQLFCNCTSARAGRYCEIDLRLDPVTHLECSGRGSFDLTLGRCVCNAQSRFSLDRSSLGMGPLCEIDVTAACGTTDACISNCGSPTYTACNGIVNNCYDLNGTGVYGCNCTNGYLPENKCRFVTPAPTTAPTRVPTATPTSAPTPTPAPTFLGTPAPSTSSTPGPTALGTPSPTAQPSVSPTLAPTAVPTVAPGTVLAGYLCPTCFTGSCVWTASAPTCVCPYPDVLAFDNLTGDCTRNMCPNSTTIGLRNGNQLACVCTDPSATQPVPNGPCTLNCPIVEGLQCGARFPLDLLADTSMRRCVNGSCVCNGFYKRDNATGACGFLCSPLHTLAVYNGICVCETDYDTSFACNQPVCRSGAYLNTSLSACQTLSPTAAPTVSPTAAPSLSPTAVPSRAPTAAPTPYPTSLPLLNATSIGIIAGVSAAAALFATLWLCVRCRKHKHGTRYSKFNDATELAPTSA